MSAPPHLGFDLRELAAQALRHGSPYHLKPTLPGLPADMREAQKVAALRFTPTLLLTPLSCKAAKLDQARLVWVQFQAKLGTALPQCLQELLGFLTLFESHDDVIDIPDETHIPQTLPLTPSVRPQIKHIMKVDIRGQG
jgi:hypothetical protein